MMTISPSELTGIKRIDEPVNEVFYEGENYYLSYVAEPNELTRILDSMFGDRSNVGIPETALCIEKPWTCYILYGDHREQYKPIANDLEKCKQYFKDNSHLIGFTSDLLEEKVNG